LDLERKDLGNPIMAQKRQLLHPQRDRRAAAAAEVVEKVLFLSLRMQVDINQERARAGKYI
jgi:hypothetical protein